MSLAQRTAFRPDSRHAPHLHLRQGGNPELHQVGANLVADAMEANGWTERSLGTNLLTSSILAAIEESSANVLCICTTIVASCLR
jgi:methanogenic corrinoid protein MtbC1